MYQHMNPCFDMMIDRLPEMLKKQVTRDQLIKLETKIIFALDFNLQCDGPLPFLERFQRVLGLDLEQKDKMSMKIGYSARRLLRHMTLKTNFLMYKPSQIAATALITAIDLNCDDDLLSLPLGNAEMSSTLSNSSENASSSGLDQMLLMEDYEQ